MGGRVKFESGHYTSASADQRCGKLIARPENWQKPFAAMRRLLHDLRLNGERDESRTFN
jgi:hypothetical protein